MPGCDLPEVRLPELAPGEPQRVQLTLRNPCATPSLVGVADTPTLVVSAKTASGRNRTVEVEPLGLDAAWTHLKTLCPASGSATSMTSVTVSGVEKVDQRTSRLTLTFDNPSSSDVRIYDARIVRGVNASTAVTSQPLQVFPHYSARAMIDLTIYDCRSAITDPAPIAVLYSVEDLDGPSTRDPMSIGSDSVSKAVLDLVYRACAKQ